MHFCTRYSKLAYAHTLASPRPRLASHVDSAFSDLRSRGERHDRHGIFTCTSICRAKLCPVFTSTFTFTFIFSFTVSRKSITLIIEVFSFLFPSQLPASILSLPLV